MNYDMKKIIDASKRIVIIPHVSADGDSIGSSLSIGLSLKKAGKIVDIFTEEKVPDMYYFLTDVDKIKNAKYFKQAEYGKHTRAALLGLTLNENGF